MSGFFRSFTAEAGSLLQRLGFRGPAMWRAWSLHLLLIVLFGFVLPNSKGLDFFDPVILGVYLCLGVVFAAPAVAHPFERPTVVRVYARILAALVYGEAMTLVMAAGGVLTILLALRGKVLFYPDPNSLLPFLIFGIMLSLATCSLAAWFTLRFSAGVAKVALRVVFLVLLLLYFLRGRSMPDLALYGIVVSLIAALGLRTILPSALAAQRGGSDA